ncbi:hypothetical protein AMECASPLE_027652 [Ameca splendens]|uniref:Uncharacterized protein n=1 Tax=Ameca splendens TaxID=208324 RepID=A0ABV0Z356_9TELE
MVLQPPASETLAATGAASLRSGHSSFSLVDLNPASFLFQAAAVLPSPYSLSINFLNGSLISGCFCCVWVKLATNIMTLLCSLKPQVGRGRWLLTMSLVLLEVSSC